MDIFSSFAMCFFNMHLVTLQDLLPFLINNFFAQLTNRSFSLIEFRNNGVVCCSLRAFSAIVIQKGIEDESVLYNFAFLYKRM